VRKIRWFYILPAIIFVLLLLPFLFVFLLLALLPVYPARQVRSREKQALIALTFDDGYKCWTSIVMPVLARYNLTATAFINDPEHLEDFTWVDAQALHKAGWEIGWHTVNHLNLGTASRSEIINDFEISKVLFQQHGLPEPVSMAYPWGKHHRDSMEIVSNYFSGARTTQVSVNSPSSVQEQPAHIAGINLTRGVSFFKEMVGKNVRQDALVVFVIHTVGQAAKWQDEPGMIVEEFEDFAKFLYREEQAGRIKVVTFREGIRQMQQREARYHWGIKVDSPFNSWDKFHSLPVPRRYYILYDRIVNDLVRHRYPQIADLLSQLLYY
jgi:hypothetical protein